MADTRISLVLGSHAHVPYGADAEEFENIYINSLRPFVSGLYKFPQIQTALHYSGVLLHWVERSHPELFMLLEDMVGRKQVEMLGGGFYEPMLPIIPAQDKIGQIELLTTYLRRQFGKRPQGCWLPGFIWEQNLVSPLAACGMSFTFLSERQFVMAGGAIAPSICEDQGKLITVFPVNQSLEESLAAGKNIGELMAALRDDYSRKGEGEAVVSIFPEKAGAGIDGPPDFFWCRFFEELSYCESFVETAGPGKLMKNLKNLPKLYVPNSSDSRDEIPPRRFIIENPEALRIYSKMIFTNVLINQLRGDKSRKQAAHNELWKAQSSDLFRYTGGHGLHDHLLRTAAYSALLEAERIARDKGKFSPSLVPFDFNMDGVEEWLFQDARINCYVQSSGGGIFELDYLPKAWNYLDTCRGRTSFADRLLPAEITADNLVPGVVNGARLYGNERYDLADLDKIRRKLRLILRSNPASPFGTVEIEKLFQVKRDTLSVGYSVLNKGSAAVSFQYAPEIDLALPGEGDAFVRFFACKASVEDTPFSGPLVHNAEGIKIHDIKNEVQITLAANRPFNGRICPLYLSEGEADVKLYQAFCIMPLFPVSLQAGESWALELTLKFTH